MLFLAANQSRDGLVCQRVARHQPVMQALCRFGGSGWGRHRQQVAVVGKQGKVEMGDD